MKTYQSLLAALLLLIASVNAVGSNGIESPTYNLSVKVKHALTMPASLKQKTTTQKITIYFAVNENGNVIKVNAKTDNAEAKKDLEDQFRKLNLKGLQPNVCNQIVVEFIVY